MAVVRRKSGGIGKLRTMTITKTMIKKLYYILTTMAMLLFVSCSDDIEQPEGNVAFCIRAAWQNGLAGGKTTRALSATDILADRTGDIVIGTADYPTTINVHCSDGTDFTLTKGAALCANHNEFWIYTPSVIYTDRQIRHDGLTFTATATIDNDLDTLTAESTIKNLHDRHLQFTLHHTKALLRFAFKVSEKYSKVRYIRVTGIQLNDAPCTIVDKVLTTSGQLIAYAYIDPAVVTTSYENTIQCTYNIYDKDDDENHLTRKDVVAQNKFKLGSLKDASSNDVTEIKAGYYYDLHVTLNPDYLYVLSEHDNKHITIE